MESYIIKNVTALYPKINQPYKFDEKLNPSMPCKALDDGASYSISFRMDEPTAKALYKAMQASYQANKKEKWGDRLERQGLFTKEDEGTYLYKANLKGAYNKQKTSPPLQVDSKGTRLPEDFLLTTGSTVNIAVTFNPYKGYGKESVNLRLKGVQVVKYIPLEDKNPFDVVEDGFTMENDSDMFKSNESTAVEEEEIEEPKKVAKKTPPPETKSTDDEISKIVDEWDDEEPEDDK